jgi:hypothetical protein
MGGNANPDSGADQLEHPLSPGGDGLGRDVQALLAKGPVGRLPEWATVTTDQSLVS